MLFHFGTDHGLLGNTLFEGFLRLKIFIERKFENIAVNFKVTCLIKKLYTGFVWIHYTFLNERNIYLKIDSIWGNFFKLSFIYNNYESLIIRFGWIFGGRIIENNVHVIEKYRPSKHYLSIKKYSNFPLKPYFFLLQFVVECDVLQNRHKILSNNMKQPLYSINCTARWSSRDIRALITNFSTTC